MKKIYLFLQRILYALLREHSGETPLLEYEPEAKKEVGEYYIRVNSTWYEKDGAERNYIMTPEVLRKARKKIQYAKSMAEAIRLIDQVLEDTKKYTKVLWHTIDFNEDECRYEHKISGDFVHLILGNPSYVWQLITVSTGNINLVSDKMLTNFLKKKPEVHLKTLQELEVESMLEELEEDPLAQEIESLKEDPLAQEIESLKPTPVRERGSTLRSIFIDNQYDEKVDAALQAIDRVHNSKKKVESSCFNEEEVYPTFLSKMDLDVAPVNSPRVYTFEHEHRPALFVPESDLHVRIVAKIKRDVKFHKNQKLEEKSQRDFAERLAHVLISEKLNK